MLVHLLYLGSNFPEGSFFDVTVDGFRQQLIRTLKIEPLLCQPTTEFKFRIQDRYQTRLGKRSLSFAQLAKNLDESNTFEREIKFRIGTARFQVTIDWPPEERAAFLQECDGGSIFDELKEIGCHNVFLQDLRSLQGWDIVMICDDSGSMAQRTENGTRWSELKDSVQRLVKLCVVLDPDGIEILFLNRSGKSGVKEAKSVQKLFKASPGGSTRLTQAFEKALRYKTEKPMIVVIATDGEPDSMQTFRAALERRPHDVYVSFLACTDNAKEVAYLDRLDDELERVDVLDDYYSERKQVQKTFPDADYTWGDHCARMLLGPVFEKYDNLDQIKF